MWKSENNFKMKKIGIFFFYINPAKLPARDDLFMCFIRGKFQKLYFS
jgi:hypothetical protein